MDYYGDLGIFLYLTPIILALAFGFVLLIKHDRTTPQIYLGISLSIIAVAMAISFWIDRYASDGRGTLRLANIIVTIWCVVSAYFYFSSLMRTELHSKKYIIKLTGGTMIYSLLVVAFYDLHEIFGTIAAIINILIECLTVIIVLFTFRQYSRFIKSRFSYSEDINLRWIIWMLLLYVVFGISDELWVFNDTIATKVFFNLSSLAVIIPLFILGFRQRITPLIDPQEDTSDNQAPQPEDPTAQESAPNEKPTGKEAELIVYFENDKPYLNPNLTLVDVATALSVNPTYLSRLINRQFNQNFYSFVNGYRTDYAIQLLHNRENKDITSDAIYISSGFKSRSVFYKLFREKTGLTPQDYIKNIAEK